MSFLVWFIYKWKKLQKGELQKGHRAFGIQLFQAFQLIRNTDDVEGHQNNQLQRQIKSNTIACHNRKHWDNCISQFCPPFIVLLVKERRGWCNNGHIVHCNKQTGRPVDSSVTVYECEGLQARQPGQNKMLHRTIFVLMVKMTILLLYTVYSIYSLAVLVLCPQQPP